MNKTINKNFCILTLLFALIFAMISANAILLLDYNNVNINSSDEYKTYLSNDQFKLFGFIPIGKSTDSASSNAKYVQLGGYPLGICINTKGLYVLSKVNVVTKDGAICPVEKCDIIAGDILYSIDGEVINNIKKIDELISDKNQVVLSIKRGENIVDYTITPALDVLSKTKKIGLMLQDNIEGIGTMTYTSDNNFYALGHTIKDMNGKNVTANGGSIYNANIIGYVKGQKGKAGELNGSFSTMSSSVGSITVNNEFGIYGQLNKNIQTKSVLLGNKSDAKPGTAYIYTTIDGNTPKMYEIQIIKVLHQNSPSEKSMVLRIVDEELLEKTGGIVQGMSGSPIIQNDKLIGAVTHVFVSDPTKGYGVFIDWMQP